MREAVVDIAGVCDVEVCDVDDIDGVCDGADRGVETM